jgi:hypothetical protein
MESANPYDWGGPQAPQPTHQQPQQGSPFVLRASRAEARMRDMDLGPTDLHHAREVEVVEAAVWGREHRFLGASATQPMLEQT